VVPVSRIDGELVGLQFIAPDGSKKFLTGTPKRGAFHLIGSIGMGADDSSPTLLIADDSSPTLLIAEGYATAASLHMATGLPVAVAFDAGNLLPVGQALRAKWPEHRLVFCADDDTETEGNPGVTKATKAAQAVGGVVAVPKFEEVA
jgi:putative DNA primase/helicase